MNLNDYLYAKVKRHYTTLAASVGRNTHMHSYTGAHRSQEDVLEMLTKYIDYTFMVNATWRERSPQETKILDLLKMLVETAREFRGLYNKNSNWKEQEALDAYLCLFINEIASDMGVDYAMYARDLEKNHADARIG